MRAHTRNPVRSVRKAVFTACTFIALGLGSPYSQAGSEQIINLSLRDFNKEADRELAGLNSDIHQHQTSAQESREYVKRSYEDMKSAEGTPAYKQAHAQWLAADETARGWRRW